MFQVAGESTNLLLISGINDFILCFVWENIVDLNSNEMFSRKQQWERLEQMLIHGCQNIQKKCLPVWEEVVVNF